MKPAPFRYARPDSLGEALDLLARHDDAKVIAGGQSLLPLMNLRLATPELLIDIGRLDDLVGVVIDDDTVRIGAMTRHAQLELDPAVSDAQPLLSAAAAQIGHRAIRNHGTIGGSLAHADAAAELPAVIHATRAAVEVTSVRGRRTIAGDELSRGHFTTSLDSDELITSVAVPRLGGRAWGFATVAPRPSDFAVAGAIAIAGETGKLIEVTLFASTARPTTFELATDTTDAGGRSDAEIERRMNDSISQLDIDPARQRLTQVVAKRAVTQALTQPSLQEAP